METAPTLGVLAAQSGPGYCVRASLVRLNPGGTIDAHQDKNFSLAHSHRIHIPLLTNPGVEFTVGNETRYLAEGEVIWLIAVIFLPELIIHLDWF